MDGIGTFTWPDGSSFVNEWKEDTSTGIGFTTFTDGSQYESEFINDEEKIKQEAK